MLQIVHDVAPAAQLFFATADVSEADFASNILALRNAPNNCDIIIDDVVYFDEPVFQDGIVAAGREHRHGVRRALLFVRRQRGQPREGHERRLRRRLQRRRLARVRVPRRRQGRDDPQLRHGRLADQRGRDHRPRCTVHAELVRSGGRVEQRLRPFPRELRGDGQGLLHERPERHAARVRADRPARPRSGGPARRLQDRRRRGPRFQRQHVPRRPRKRDDGPDARPLIRRRRIQRRRRPRGGGLRPGVRQRGRFPGPFGSSNQVELFTSDGPRRIFYDAAGTPITPGNVLFGTNGGIVRAKPDITAADGVSTTLPPTSGLNPFYGTSAAAPHAGAIAGLLKSANPALTPPQIRAMLTTTAVDVESAGYDNISGFGIVQAFKAMQAVAPTPLATLLLGTVTAAEGAFSNGNGIARPGRGRDARRPAHEPLDHGRDRRPGDALDVDPRRDDHPARRRPTARSRPRPRPTNGATPFVLAVTSSVPCGTAIEMSLNVTFGGGTSPLVFPFSVAVGKVQAPLSSTLGPFLRPDPASPPRTASRRAASRGTESRRPAPRRRRTRA